MSGYVGSPKCALHGTKLSRLIRCSQLASYPEVVAVFHECVVRLFSHVVTPESLSNCHVCNETLYDGKNGGRTRVTGAVGTLEVRGAVHKHYDVQRPPEKSRERTRGMDVYQFHRPLCARRRVVGSWCPVPLGYQTC